jgi:hypothetical protein
MSISTPPIYLYTLVDVPGVVAANNFLAVFNPANSGKVHVALQLIVASYSGGVTATANSLISKRITASSGGTLVSASTVARFRTDWDDPASAVRIDNPTVTTSGLGLAVVSPVVSAGVGQSSAQISPPPGASFVMTPGQGLVFYTAGGDVDQVWNITYLWTEADA